LVQGIFSLRSAQLSFRQDAWPDGLTYLENHIPEVARKLAQEVDAVSWRTDLKRREQHYGYRYDYKARQARRDEYLGPGPDLFSALGGTLPRKETGLRRFLRDAGPGSRHQALPRRSVSANRGALGDLNCNSPLAIHSSGFDPARPQWPGLGAPALFLRTI